MVIHFIIIFACLPPYEYGATLADKDRLMRDVFRNKSKVLIPSDNTLNVTVSFNPVNLVAVSEIKEAIKIIGIFRFVGRDQTISWTLSIYANIESMYLASKFFWLPSVALTNPASNFMPIDSTRELVLDKCSEQVAQ